VARAEDSGLDPGSIDLVAVAQALHWFDVDAFFAEAGRVMKPDGLLAFWCYQNCIVDDEIDPLIARVYADVGEFWPPERVFVEERYPHVVTPFEERPAGAFEISIPWSAAQLINYMRTWSATQRYMAARGTDPTAAYEGELRRAWGDKPRTVRWPIVLRVCRNSET